jgi:hypothetical protein
LRTLERGVEDIYCKISHYSKCGKRRPSPLVSTKTTAFSILLFTEIRKLSGFFPQGKAALHDFVTSACESKIL